MKAIEWIKFLQEQREQYNKVVFTATELANAGACKGSSIKVVLQRLIAQGVIERYSDGCYGQPGAATIEDLVPALDSTAYITGMYAMYSHQIITQVPMEIRCFSGRRHNRSRIRNTTLGKIVFVCVTGSVYSYPGSSPTAAPEQALCDFVYDCRRRQLRAQDLVSFRNLDRLNADLLKKELQRYPATVAREINALVDVMSI